MKHARDDYNRRIQDCDNIIPKEEPVFLLRGQDISAPETLEFWADQNEKNGGEKECSRLAREQAEEMRRWQCFVKKKPSDLPESEKRN